VAVVAFFAVLGLASGGWLARIPAIKHSLQLSDGMLGVALLAAPIGLVALVTLASRVIDRAGSRATAVAAGTGAALLPIAAGLAPDLPVLMAALFTFGGLSGLMDVAMNSQAVQVQQRFGRPLMSSFHACYSFGALAGSLLGGLCAWAGVSPAVNFVLAGLPLAGVVLLAGRWLIPGRPPAPGEPAGGQRAGDERAGDERAGDERAGDERAGDERAADSGGPAASAGRISRLAVSRTGLRWASPLLLLGLLAVCSLLGEGAADSWSAVYLHDNLGTSAAFAALGFAAFSVTMAFGRLTGDKLALRFGPAVLVRGSGLLAAAGLTGALLSHSPAVVVAGFAVFGAGLSCTFPQLLSAAGNADPARPAGGIARVAGMGYAGLLGGPVLIGGVASAVGLTAALGIPALLALGIAAGAGAAGLRPAPRG